MGDNFIIYTVVLIFGTIIGSFLNVCIYRIPLGLSIVSPGSRCPACNSPLRFYDNIPIISYILLGGRCRTCGEGISIVYPLVELFSGMVSLLVFLRFGPGPEYILYYLFSASLIVVSFIDLRHRIIPNVVTLPGIVVGLVGSMVFSVTDIMDSLLGVLLGGGVLIGIAFIYHLLTGKEGMGGGDVKLLAMVGAFLGWKGVVVTLMVGSLVGALVGGVFILLADKDSRYLIPFGPFLSLGAFFHLLLGQSAIEWYLSMVFAI